MSPERVSVLIAGGGTVGLSMAAALAHHGVPALVVERRAGTSQHPRATGVQPTVKEFFRSIGVDDGVRVASEDLAPSMSKVNVTTLTREELAAAARIDTPPIPVAEATLKVSPTTIGPCAQDQIDIVLHEAAVARGATVRFRTAFESLTQDADGVEATLLNLDTGERTTVRADYLVAADGSSSRVRKALGIEMVGPDKLGNPMLNILCRVDLADVVRGHEFAFGEVNNDKTEGIVLAINNRDRWVYHVSYTAGVETADDYPPARCRDLVRAAIGQPDADVEILSIIPWQMAAQVADRLRDGRIVLVGDAAHVIPPIGAFGMSTGVADAHNLAWKLAMVVKGQAGPGLLEAYAIERRQVARFTRDQALLRFTHLDLHWDAEKDAERAEVKMADPLVTALGFRYAAGAVVDPQESMPSLEDISRNLDGAPGSRAPHKWVELDGKRVSTLDTVSTGFAVLAGPQGTAWRDAAAAVAERTGLPLAGYRVGPQGELVDADGTWAAQAGVGDSGALLVRPDGFVAWRATGADADPEGVLTSVLTQILDRK